MERTKLLTTCEQCKTFAEMDIIETYIPEDSSYMEHAEITKVHHCKCARCKQTQMEPIMQITDLGKWFKELENGK